MRRVLAETTELRVENSPARKTPADSPKLPVLFAQTCPTSGTHRAGLMIASDRGPCGVEGAAGNEARAVYQCQKCQGALDLKVPSTLLAIADEVIE